MSRLKMRAQQQNKSRPRMVRREMIVPLPQVVSKPGRRRANVGMAIVTIDAPRLQHAIHVSIRARTPNVIHHLIAALLDQRLADASSDVVEHSVPRGAFPLTG